MAHAISLAAWMLSSGAVPKAPGAIPHMLTMFFAMHAILSIVLLISANRGSRKNKGKAYAKLNAPTVVQRISGILLIIFTALHITGASGLTHTPPAVLSELKVCINIQISGTKINNNIASDIAYVSGDTGDGSAY